MHILLVEDDEAIRPAPDFDARCRDCCHCFVHRRRPTSNHQSSYTMKFILLAILIVACGATCRSARVATADRNVAANRMALEEESRALTTGARDALYFAPTNPPTSLAARFLDRDQQIEGIPINRIDVAGVLAGNKPSVTATDARLDMQGHLLKDRVELEAKLEAANQRLLELGRLYETEHKKSLIKRIWLWATGVFGIGGIIALMIFFPFLIPIFGSVVTWIIGLFPKIAGVIGLVGKKSFDGVVIGVQKVREKMEKDTRGGVRPDQVKAVMESGEPLYTSTQVQAMLDNALAVATDRKDKKLIASRKKVLKDVIQSEPSPATIPVSIAVDSGAVPTLPHGLGSDA
jgi:hypothetical protein